MCGEHVRFAELINAERSKMLAESSVRSLGQVAHPPSADGFATSSVHTLLGLAADLSVAPRSRACGEDLIVGEVFPVFPRPWIC